MRPDMLRIDGVTAETKNALRSEAQRVYGKPNVSLFVRQLIGKALAKSESPALNLSKEDNNDSVRVELRLPRRAVEELDKRAEAVFSPRNYYLTSIILSSIGNPQLQGAEIETLRRSNFELSKIGTNMNQIAKAFNVLVNSGNGKMPEIGKKMVALQKDIKEHTGKVLNVLDAGTAVFEQRRGNPRPLGRGRIARAA